MRLLNFSATSTASSTFLKAAALLAMLLMPSAGHCEDAQTNPVFTHLQTGEAATFSGYLLSPEAVGTVITVDDERRLKELAAKDLAFSEERAGLVRQIREAGARVDRLSGEIVVITDARQKERDAYEDEISRLKKRAILFAAIGAACGGAAVGVASLL